MSDIDTWIVIGLLALGTFLARATFWLVGHHMTIPDRVRQALRFAPACALAAVIVPDLLLNQNHFEFSVLNPHLIGGVVASVFFLYQRSMIATIIVGMAAFTLVRLYS